MVRSTALLALAAAASSVNALAVRQVQWKNLQLVAPKTEFDGNYISVIPTQVAGATAALVVISEVDPRFTYDPSAHALSYNGDDATTQAGFHSESQAPTDQLYFVPTGNSRVFYGANINYNFQLDQETMRVENTDVPYWYVCSVQDPSSQVDMVRLNILTATNKEGRQGAKAAGCTAVKVKMV